MSVISQNIRFAAYIFCFSSIFLLTFIVKRTGNRSIKLFTVGWVLLFAHSVLSVFFYQMNISEMYKNLFGIFILLLLYTSIYFFSISLISFVRIKSYRKYLKLYFFVLISIFLCFVFFLIFFHFKEPDTAITKLIFTPVFFISFGFLGIQPIILIYHIRNLKGRTKKIGKELVIIICLFLLIIFSDNFIGVFFEDFYVIPLDIVSILFFNCSIVYLCFRYGLSSNEKTRSKEDYINSLVLTKREKDVCSALLENYSYKEIGEKLNISVDTIKTHASNIYKKNKFRNRNELLDDFKRAYY